MGSRGSRKEAWSIEAITINPESVLGDKGAIEVFGGCSVYVRWSCSARCPVVGFGMGSPALSLRSSSSSWASWALEM